MAFILILSPKRAPPVFRFEGSTDTIPTVFLGKSNAGRDDLVIEATSRTAYKIK